MKSKSIVFHSYLFIEGAVRSALSRMNMSMLWWVTYLDKFVNVLSAIVSLLFFLIKQILNLHVSSFFYKIRSRFFYYHFVIMYIILLLFYLPSNDFFRNYMMVRRHSLHNAVLHRVFHRNSMCLFRVLIVSIQKYLIIIKVFCSIFKSIKVTRSIYVYQEK